MKNLEKMTKKAIKSLDVNEKKAHYKARKVRKNRRNLWKEID